MARGRCHSMDNPQEATLGLASCSITILQITTDEPATNASASAAPSVFDIVTEHSSTTPELTDAEASIATTSTQRATTNSPEHATRPPP
jgi:hypothetical protein